MKLYSYLENLPEKKSNDWLEYVNCQGKGQLISNFLFMVTILPKNELENSYFCTSLLGQTFFVNFLGELKKSKCPSEMNWPL